MGESCTLKSAYHWQSYSPLLILLLQHPVLDVI